MISVRLRLLLLALLPLVVLMPLLLGAAMVRWIDKFDQLLISKVASDLRIAEQYLDRLQDIQAANMTALARSAEFAQAAAKGPEALEAFLEQSKEALQLDFLVLGSAALPGAARQVAEVSRRDVPSASLALLSAGELDRLSPDLSARAAIPLVATEAARLIDRDVETRGMVLLAADRLETGATLVGGRLLNRNLDFIDTINDLVYRNVDETEARTGTTTLFLDDVRISTNVRLFEGSRALGTRVSEVVWTSVMQGGETWLDRAFVVNDWYISGYLPISDIKGKRIGMLYVGFLESGFTAQKNATIIGLVIAFIAVIGLSIPIFLRLAQGVFSPLERMSRTMKKVEAGAMDARIGEVGRNDEIGDVASHLDRLLDQVQERDAELRGWAEKLNETVDQRTKELRKANRKLETTFEQLVMAEKLASIGEITAGVAHEINNPVAVIQGNLEVLRNSLGEHEDKHKTELDLIDAQTFRINMIVNRLLSFTRQSEMADMAVEVDLQQAVIDALILVAPDLRKGGIELIEEHFEAPQVRIVETELQQVLVNLMINAAQAMPDGGSLTLTTGAASRDGQTGAEVRVLDTGTGIAPEKLAHVFDPFFTTKPAEGTGLGLSISQTLITRAGGLISVRSSSGQGTEFIVWIPAMDNSSDG